MLIPKKIVLTTMPRPKKKIIRGERVTVRYTKSEYLVLSNRAKLSGLMIAEYIREKSLSGRIRNPLNKEKKELHRSLVMMANDLHHLIEIDSHNRVSKLQSTLNNIDQIIEQLI